MARDQAASHRAPGLAGLASVGGRAAAATLRPLADAVGAAAGAGIGVERRAVDRLLDGDELERLMGSDRLQAVFRRLLESDGAKQLVDSFFDSGLFDHFVDRLLASDSLWRLVDEIANSPGVTAAISQQGLGFVDQVGGELRARSRHADDWLEHAARRLGHRHPDPAVRHGRGGHGRSVGV